MEGPINLEPRLMPRLVRQPECQAKHTTARARVSRNFREIFAKFREVFANFRKFSKFSEVGRRAGTCSDLVGCIRTRSDTLGSVRKRSDAFGIFRIFFDFFRACAKYRRSQ